MQNTDFIKNIYEVNFGAYRPQNGPHFICSLNRFFFLSAFLFVGSSYKRIDSLRNVYLLLGPETERTCVLLVLNELLFVIP